MFSDVCMTHNFKEAEYYVNVEQTCFGHLVLSSFWFFFFFKYIDKTAVNIFIYIALCFSEFLLFLFRE